MRRQLNKYGEYVMTKNYDRFLQLRKEIEGGNLENIIEYNSIKLDSFSDNDLQAALSTGDKYLSSIDRDEQGRISAYHWKCIKDDCDCDGDWSEYFN